MNLHEDKSPTRIGRRHFLAGAGAAAVAGSFGTLGVARPASAKAGLPRALPAPSSIPGGVAGIPGHPVLDFIHWFLPGPTDATTPFIGLPGFGLDVEPSLITDYRGFTAFAVLSGQARGSDGKTYNVEFDVRVMEGEYVAADGSHQRGAFGFF